MSHFVYLILVAGFFLFGLLAFYTFKRMGKGWSIKALYKDFNRKMWMTLFLGGVFFSLYVLIVYLCAYMLPLWGSEIFFLVYQYPVYFIYLGLSLFACMSLSIYLVRMVIKYLYLTRGRDG